MKSNLKCPVCNNPLNVERHPDTPDGYYILWCGVGRCPSTAANDGASGPTEQEAFEQLKRCIVLERWHEEGRREACKRWSSEEERERRQALAADHANDLKRNDPI